MRSRRILRHSVPDSGTNREKSAPLGHMAVNIERKGRRRVAQIALHGLDVVAGADRGHSAGVLEIVKAGVWSSDLLRRFLESTVHGRLGERPSDLVGKHKRGVPTQLADLEALLCLFALVLLQEGHNRRCGRDGAALAVLRAAELKAVARLALVEEGLLADRNRTGLKVYVIPREAEHLALTHTGEKRDRQQRFKNAVICASSNGASSLRSTRGSLQKSAGQAQP